MARVTSLPMPWPMRILWGLTVAAVLFGSGLAASRISLTGADSAHSFVVWPLTAIALVATLRLGLFLLPFVAAGNLLLAVDGRFEWAEVVSIAAGDCVSIALAAAILSRRTAPLSPLTNVADFTAFVLVGCGLQGVVDELVNAGLAVALKGLDFPETLAIAARMLDSVMGSLLFAPMLWGIATPLRKPEGFAAWAEFAALLAYALVSCHLAFRWPIDSPTWNRVVPFFVFPAVLWAGIRFGHGGVTFVLLLSCGVAVSGIYERLGSFATVPPQAGVTALHVFLGLASAAGFLVSTALEERWRTQAALRESERKYRYLVETSADLIWSVDRHGCWTYINQAVRHTHGYEPAELIGHPFYELYISPEQREKDLQAFQRIKGGEPHFRYETVHRRRDGQPVYLSFNAVVLTNEAGEVVGTTGTAADITERVKAEQRLRESETRFRSIFENSPLGICIGRDGRSLYVNPEFVRMFGYESADEVLGVPLVALVPPEYRERVATRLARPDPLRPLARSYEGRGLRRDGTTFPLSVAVEWIPQLPGGGAFVGFVADLTDRQTLEERLRQAQKMEAVGRLAGGIAHDFNNLLTVILGYTEVIKSSSREGSEVQRAATEVARAGERAASLTQQLLTFSRRQVVHMVPLDLNVHLASTAGLLRRIIGDDIDLTTELRADPAVILGDPTQIDQVLLNLAINARDAMPKGGSLFVSTVTVDLVPESPELARRLAPGRFVRLTVRDTGHGMDSATMAHVFEPFYTTKGDGKGTGLGLAVVYGIVRQMGGHVSVDAALGRGTRFEIYWPVFQKSLPVVSSAGDAGPNRNGDRRKARILLVEDEALVRGFAKSALEAEGHRVLEADSGATALAIVRSHRGEIDLLLTDVVMPQMGGPELAREIVKLDSGIRVLYMSGYSEVHDFESIRAELRAPMLPKPFSPRQLAEGVRNALGPSTL